MSKKINYVYRELEGDNSYTFENLEKEMKKFKEEYPDGKDFEVSISCMDCYENVYIQFQCYSPETEEEIQYRKRNQIPIR